VCPGESTQWFFQCVHLLRAHPIALLNHRQGLRRGRAVWIVRVWREWGVRWSGGGLGMGGWWRLGGGGGGAGQAGPRSVPAGVGAWYAPATVGAAPGPVWNRRWKLYRSGTPTLRLCRSAGLGKR
jgi:hypothetical protein